MIIENCYQCPSLDVASGRCVEPNGPEGVLLDQVGVDDDCPLPDYERHHQ